MVEARLASPPGFANLEYITKPELVDEALAFPETLAVDLAHVTMLSEKGILTSQTGATLLQALLDIEKDGRDALPVEPARGSYLLQIEHELARRVGADAAGRVHTGRSRNDWSGAISRLFARNRLLTTVADLCAVQDTLIALAAEHVETYMPGYTHLQHAQPITLAHYLLRHHFVFERDLQRLEGAFARTNLSALGGAALAGTSWPLDRNRVADLLGHEGLVENAIDTGVFTRDYPVENIGVLALAMTNAGNLASDMYLWSTWEFGFVEVADELAGTSSIMPQKKNPHVFERIRGLSGRAIGWVPATMGMTRAASSSDLDLYWGGDLMPSAALDTHFALRLLDEGLAKSRFRTDLMRERAGIDWSTATYLTDEIARTQDLPFRVAHQIVGRFVRVMNEKGLGMEQASSTLLDQAATEITGSPLSLGDEFVTKSLQVEVAVKGLITRGSAHPDQGRAMVATGRELQSRHRAWLETKTALVAGARSELEGAIASLVAAAGTAPAIAP
ncbi:MAG TPA: argininosuccinate lyase [Solirubrobacteraceae bacterium]|jgi:argininosuccinate lyase